MNQSPFYHIQNPQWRVVYRPHGRWMVQKRSERMPTRESDPWDDIGLPKVDKDQATKAMYQHLPLVVRS